MSQSAIVWWAIIATIAAFALWLAYRNEDSKRKTAQQWLSDAHARVSAAQRDKLEVERVLAVEKRQFDSIIARVLLERQGETRLLKEKTISFPWLATAIADFHNLVAERDAERMRLKKNPAIKSAEKVAEYARARRSFETQARILRYRIEYYEKLFPWLIDLVGEDVDKLVARIVSRTPANEAVGEEPEEDEASKYLTEAEYRLRPPAERYQLALDRYLKSRKSNWEIGRDYERFVGYGLEKAGFSIEYKGILDGYEDLGRDIIAKKSGEVRIVQCKRWSAERTIHEKHIFQLYGTFVEYVLSNNLVPDGAQTELFRERVALTKVTPWFVTTTTLSEKARKFALLLGVKLEEESLPTPYPMIKCNISRVGSEKIYHLPFDQQYDRVIVEPQRGERYASTVAEAEAGGFRRAMRWQGGESRKT